MTREEAIKVLSSYDVNGVWADVDGKPYNAEEQAEAFDMAIEALSADTAYGVGRYEKAMQKLREMPKYLNGIKEKQIKKRPSEVVEVVRCKNCKHFTLNYVENVDGIPLIMAHEICSFWGDDVKHHKKGFVVTENGKMKIAINISEYDQEWIRNAYGIPAEINTIIAEAIIDGEELVRCKNCKYGEIDDEDFPWQYFCHQNGDAWNDENHFCSDGERKDDS